MSTITLLEVQKRNKERVNVFLDGEYVFSLPIIEAAKLRKGQELNEDEISELREIDSIARAVDRAVNFLSYRPRSMNEVRRNLIDKGIAEPVIDMAIERLIVLGYLDDEAFARFWVDNRNQFKPMGARALRYELRQKGVDDDIISAVLSETDDYDLAYSAAQNRMQRFKGTEIGTFRNKMGSFLQRRGFNYAIIKDVVEQLIEESGEGFFSISNDELP